MESFNGMYKFLELARQTLLLEALELWSYEVMAMMSGFLSITQQASMSIDWSISFLCIYIPYSFYMSVSTLVGAALGEGDIRKAKDTFRIIFMLSATMVIAICTTMFLSSRNIVSFYATDPKVVSYASDGLRAYIGASFGPFFVQMMLMGLISGVGI
jgi:Na+-driven multidrug efflux pump